MERIRETAEVRRVERTGGRVDPKGAKRDSREAKRWIDVLRDNLDEDREEQESRRQDAWMPVVFRKRAAPSFAEEEARAEEIPAPGRRGEDLRTVVAHAEDLLRAHCATPDPGPGRLVDSQA